MINKLDYFYKNLIMTIFYSLNIIFSILTIVSFAINLKVLLLISVGFLFLFIILSFLLIFKEEMCFNKIIELIFLSFYSILLILLIFHFYNFAFATNIIKYSMYLVLLIVALISGAFVASSDKFFTNPDSVIFAIMVILLPIVYSILKIISLYKRDVDNKGEFL